MISIIADPLNPDRLILSAAVTIYLDRILVSILSDEVEAAIRAQAVKDLQGNKAVQKQIAQAATAKLLQMLGVDSPDSKDVANPTPDATPKVV